MPDNLIYRKKNYLLAITEGGFFMGGMAFLSMESVMPAMIHELGGPGWAVSFAPGLFIIGFCWPQIFSALWVERRRAMKPIIIGIGTIQRIPYLPAGLFLILAGREHPQAAMWIALMTPFVMSSLGGIQGSAYFELISRMVPVRRTASMWATRNVLMAGFGILAGFVIKYVLDANPGATGYGILHLITFGMMLISLSLFSLVKETNVPDEQKQDPVCFRSGFRAFWQQWQKNPSLGRFVITRMLFMLIFVVVPFLSIRAINQTGQSVGLVGQLVTMQMIGFIVGNLLSGYLGDKLGVRLPMLLGRLLLLLGVIFAPFSVAIWQFLAIFFLLGFGLSTAQVGDLTMVFDFAPPYRRKFFFAVMGVLVVPGVLAASLISAALQYIDNGFYIACLISFVGVAISLVYLMWLRDPRQHSL